MEKSKKIVGIMYLGISALTGLLALSVFVLVLLNQWGWPTEAAAAGISIFGLISLLTGWCWRLNLRRSEDLFLLRKVRQMGGRTTVPSLCEQTRRSVRRINRFLELKVAKGQAVVALEDDEPLYIFEGFVDHTGKELGFL